MGLLELRWFKRLGISFMEKYLESKRDQLAQGFWHSTYVNRFDYFRDDIEKAFKAGFNACEEILREEQGKENEKPRDNK